MSSKVVVMHGATYTLRKVNVFRDEAFTIAEGAVVMHTEVVLNDDTEVLEMWVAEPFEPVEVVDHPTPTPSSGIFSPTTPEEDGFVVVEEDVEDDDEFY